MGCLSGLPLLLAAPEPLLELLVLSEPPAAVEPEPPLPAPASDPVLVAGGLAATGAGVGVRP